MYKTIIYGWTVFLKLGYGQSICGDVHSLRNIQKTPTRTNPVNMQGRSLARETAPVFSPESHPANDLLRGASSRKYRRVFSWFCPHGHIYGVGPSWGFPVVEALCGTNSSWRISSKCQ